MPRKSKIQIRGGTAAEWTAADPILADREMGLETDTQKIKFGDGVTAWSGLPYAGGGAGTVTAVTGTPPIASTGGATPAISIADFVASGASHAKGAVPDPGAVAGTTKFLREDASWQIPAGGMFTFTNPVDGDFAWINQGDASIVVTGNWLALVAPTVSGATGSIRIRKKAAPSTPYTITIAIIGAFPSKNYRGMGLCFRQSSDGKLCLFGPYFSTSFGLSITKFTSPTVFSADYVSPANAPWVAGWPMFLRIADNGTNRICSASQDGSNFVTIHTVGRTDFLTADEVGFFLQPQDNVTPNYTSVLTLLSWAQA